MQPGARIGPFRLERRIGEGGMGEVFLAERVEGYQQRVAIKLVRQAASSADVIRRFVIERQTLAALNHPHIVRLLDGGTEAGTPYLVVEYVEGVPIDRYCDQNRVSVNERLRLFLDVCDAVQFAHRNLVVHCDLKPANILVTAEGEARLLDFGIAKLLDPVAIGITAEAAKTRHRAFTAEFASPEQLRGEPVTTATDIYALGVILYGLLTGRGPYRSGGDSIVSWIHAVCEVDAELPSTAIHRETVPAAEYDPPPETAEQVGYNRGVDPRSLERALRGDLDAIVLKALRKQPQDRYGSVGEMSGDLQRYLAGEPVLARRNTAGYVFRKFLERHKLAVAGAALLLLTVAGGVVTTLWQARIAARRFQEVRGLAHTFLFDVHDAIQYLPGSTAARSLIARTGTDYLDRLAGEAHGDSSLNQELAEGYLKIGDVEGNPYGSNLGHLDKAVENYKKALAIAESLAARQPGNLQVIKVLGKAHYDLAAVLPLAGKVPEGLGHAQEALRLYRRILGTGPATAESSLLVSAAYEQIGDVELRQSGRKEALEAYSQSLALLPGVGAADPLYARVARARAVEMAKIAQCEADTGDRAAAIAKLQDALRIAEDLARADPNNVRAREVPSNLLNKIAYNQESVGDLNGARASYSRALEIDEAGLKADPNNSRARDNVTVTLLNSGDLNFYYLKNNAEALACYRRAAGLLEAACQADPDNVLARQRLAITLTYIGSTLLATGHEAEARQADLRGLKLAKELADRPGATQENLYNYAWLATTMEPFDLRDFKSALPYAKKAVDLRGGADPFSLHVLAQAYAGTEDYADAIRTVEKAIALFGPHQAGKPPTAQQQTLENELQDFQKELNQRSGK